MSQEPKQADQGKSIWGIEHEVFLKLVKQANAFVYEVELLLKDRKLSSAHYNILRILRGAGKKGLPCNAISERLLVKSPDITRLLDRLEKKDLITRERSRTDRRVVNALINTKGLDVLAFLDDPMKNLHKKQLGHLEQKKLKKLSGLLDDLSELYPDE